MVKLYGLVGGTTTLFFNDNIRVYVSMDEVKVLVGDMKSEPRRLSWRWWSRAGFASPPRASSVRNLGQISDRFHFYLLIIFALSPLGQRFDVALELLPPLRALLNANISTRPNSLVNCSTSAVALMATVNSGTFSSDYYWFT